MKIKWKENAGTGAISIHGPEADFAAKYDPEAVYEVNEPTAAKLLAGGLFEAAAGTPRKKRAAKNEGDETEFSENKEKEN